MRNVLKTVQARQAQDVSPVFEICAYSAINVASQARRESLQDPHFSLCGYSLCSISCGFRPLEGK